MLLLSLHPKCMWVLSNNSSRSFSLSSCVSVWVLLKPQVSWDLQNPLVHGLLLQLQIMGITMCLSRRIFCTLFYISSLLQIAHAHMHTQASPFLCISKRFVSGDFFHGFIQGFFLVWQRDSSDHYRGSRCDVTILFGAAASGTDCFIQRHLAALFCFLGPSKTTCEIKLDPESLDGEQQLLYSLQSLGLSGQCLDVLVKERHCSKLWEGQYSRKDTYQLLHLSFQ